MCILLTLYESDEKQQIAEEKKRLNDNTQRVLSLRHIEENNHIIIYVQCQRI